LPPPAMLAWDPYSQAVLLDRQAPLASQQSEPSPGCSKR